MPTGDITLVYVGRFAAGSSALKTAVDNLNTGAATSGSDIKTIHMIPTGVNGQSVDVYTLARLA